MKRELRAYWAAWGEVLQLAREVSAEMGSLIKWQFILRVVASLLLLGWVLGEALLLSAGRYGEAAASFFGSILLGLLVGGHIAARAIMRENARDHDD